MKIAKLLAVAAILMGTPVGINPVLGTDYVVVSIKPLHSLVSNVMHGAGQPHLLVHGTASPHIFSLKPSNAKRLREAKVIFWIGEILEAALIKPIKTLGIQANLVTLSKLDGLKLLKARNSGLLDNKSHENHNHAHNHSEIDGHLWLDPDNAKIFIDGIERALTTADPKNANLYRKNSQRVRTRLRQISRETENTLRPVKGRPFIVFHDAYQYFENRFDIPAVGSIVVDANRPPGAKRIAAIKRKIQTVQAVCVFTEPQFSPKLATRLASNLKVRTGILDPLGANIEAGPEHYFRLMGSIATNLASCLNR